MLILYTKLNDLPIFLTFQTQVKQVQVEKEQMDLKSSLLMVLAPQIGIQVVVVWAKGC